MGFPNREKRRLIAAKRSLFGADAAEAGIYKKKCREFCLRGDCSDQNLHQSRRAEAIGYFTSRRIQWHNGICNVDGVCLPSNHVLSSQVACVNAWCPFSIRGDALLGVVRALGYAADEMLPMNLDRAPGEASAPFVSFEWIGQKNYLGERTGRRRSSDAGRRRGMQCTSADFAFRFRQGSQVHLVLGEWKYTEQYRNICKRFAGGRSKTDRFGIYGSFINAVDSPLALPEGVVPDALFYDPFDQLMRLQLLGREMERAGEMGADVVSVLHVAPRVNTEFTRRITSPSLSSLGTNVHEIWGRLVRDGLFRGCDFEALLPALTRHAPAAEWGRYMAERYGGMR